MHCQLHLDIEAASICVSCGRALCRDCQKTTRDERKICGLPQCEEFVKRQAGVQIATRQSCANNAESQLLLAELCRSLAIVLLLLGSGLIIAGGLATGLSALGALRSAGVDFVSILLFMIGAAFLLMGMLVRRLPSKLIAQARNWEDISREFDDTTQTIGPHEDETQ